MIWSRQKGGQYRAIQDLNFWQVFLARERMHECIGMLPLRDRKAVGLSSLLHQSENPAPHDSARLIALHLSHQTTFSSRLPSPAPSTLLHPTTLEIFLVQRSHTSLSPWLCGTNRTFPSRVTSRGEVSRYKNPYQLLVHEQHRLANLAFCADSGVLADQTKPLL